MSIAEDYQNNMKVEDISEKHGVSVTTVYNKLREEGIPRDRNVITKKVERISKAKVARRKKEFREFLEADPARKVRLMDFISEVYEGLNEKRRGITWDG